MKKLSGLTKVIPILLLLGLTGCPEEVKGSFQIINAAPGVMITELYLVPSGNVDKGPNLLERVGALGLGGSYTIRNLKPGYYDELAKAVVLSTSDFVQLPNPQILVDSGSTYVHTVYWTDEDYDFNGPTLDDVTAQP